MSKSTEFYKNEIQALDTWGKLGAFLQDIQNDNFDKSVWAGGKAFEFFILRCFEFDGAEVTYPYEVEMF